MKGRAKGEARGNASDSAAVADYKRILQQVLDNRPGGTRLRLAEALGKNRSFISQIANPAYSVPIPARHIERIFETCHFLGAEKAQFMKAYQRAHPDRASGSGAEPRWRELVLRVPDLRDRNRNKLLDDLLKETLAKALRLIEGK
jgi:hypothetical protein